MRFMGQPKPLPLRGIAGSKNLSQTVTAAAALSISTL
jgi:hypothetical protein